MLKARQLTVDHKQALILITFSILLIETLTLPTVIFVLLGGLFIFLRFNPGVMFRHFTALGLFGVYWFTYGKLIDPEVGLNFLTSIMVVKLLEKESLRDRYMIFFGIMLLISSGALFQKSLLYVFFFGLSFYILIQDFYAELGLPSKFKNLLKLILWILPFTALIFVFAPRLMSPFQIKKEQIQNGEIGYTPNVNISSIESLSGNDSPVFQASIDGLLVESFLYWRGNTVSSTDGWNWFTASSDQNIPDFHSDPNPGQISDDLIHQKIRLINSQEFYFGLDYPTKLKTLEGFEDFIDARSFKQSLWKKTLRYEIYSKNVPHFISDTSNFEHRIFRSGVRRQDQNWIRRNFKEGKLKCLLHEIQTYFKKENFSYSLSPGRVDDFSSFMIKKKTGFCSHYASAVALILRTKGFATRLVSGFLGGTFNRYGRFYQITQNDAHAWVEVWDQNGWRRIDPTDWIAPERIKLGGEAFVQNSGNKSLSMSFLRPYMRHVDELKQWLTQWDYRFYNFIEEMDYEGQRAFLDKYGINKNIIFSLIPLLLVLFSLIYSLHLFQSQKKHTHVEKLWNEYFQKLKKRGLKIEFDSIENIRSVIHGKDPLLEEILDDLILETYSFKKVRNLSKKIKRI